MAGALFVVPPSSAPPRSPRPRNNTQINLFFKAAACRCRKSWAACPQGKHYRARTLGSR